MLKLYSFYADCGRMGSLSGLFVEDDSVVAKAIGKHAYFGEVLGKHSEIEGTLEESEITVVSEDQDKIQWLIEVTGGWWSISGINPMDYINLDDEEDEEEQEED